MSKSHPYLTMPAQAFWKTGVAPKNPEELQTALYRPKFSIDNQTKIATAGSCFAQHIGAKIRDAGGTVLDMEPPPGFLSKHEWRKFGFAMFSARYGNIYVPKHLLQLFQRACGEFSPKTFYWKNEDHYLDPFRPSISPHGFETIDELSYAQSTHLKAVRQMLEQTELLVFTLGLTETWSSNTDGAIYPTVPGAVGGTFDPKEHKFKNFSYEEIFEDTQDALQLARSINPKLKVLLTVSPVALVATATPHHVLLANTYSKSVLRAVAGKLSEDFKWIDYFPSYELISSHITRGLFYDMNNMRTVTAQGVELALNMFIAQHFLDVFRSPSDRKSIPKPRVHSTPEEAFCDQLVYHQTSSNT